MMIFDEFAVELQTELEKHIDGVTIRSSRIKKNNGVELLGLSICDENSPVAPTVYVNDYYSAYTSGVPIEKIASDLAKAYSDEQRFKLDVDVNKFSNPEYVKSHIVYTLVSKDKNKELLKEVPHRDYLDLSIMLRVVMHISYDDSIASVVVKNDHLKMWNLSDYELFDLAKFNTERLFPAKIMSMGSILGTTTDADSFMYVVTNANKCNGAGVILYNDLLRDFSETLDTDLYILPSSIHETIVVRADAVSDVEGLKELVKCVNGDVVNETEILSDSVYKYSLSGELVKVA